MDANTNPQWASATDDSLGKPLIAEVERGDMVADQLRSTVTELIARLEHVTTPATPEPGENASPLTKIEGPPLAPTVSRIRSTSDVVDTQIERLRKLLRDLQL